MWMTSCIGSARRGSLGFWRKSISWVLRSEEEGWRSLAHRSQASGLVSGAHVVWGRWKSQHRKNVYVSPKVEKNLNSKVIKVFVPELRSRYVFFMFRDSYVLCIYVMNILCTFPIFMYGYVTLTLTLWPINSGVLTSFLLPHLPSSLTDSLPSLNLLSHSKTDARSMQDGRKAVWSFHTFLWHFFPSLKHNSIAYRSSKVSRRPDCIFEIHQLWQSGFSRVYSNCCCSCSFEPEIIKTGQSSILEFCSYCCPNICRLKVLQVFAILFYFLYPFGLCSFCSHILLLNCFIFFASGYSFVLLFFPPTFQ